MEQLLGDVIRDMTLVFESQN